MAPALSPAEKAAAHEAELERRRLARAEEKRAKSEANKKAWAEEQARRRQALDAARALGRAPRVTESPENLPELTPNITFTEFSRLCGVNLTPGQRVIARVAYDGLDPQELAPDELAIAREIFGHIDSIPTRARDVFTAVVGARGGKSSILVALRLLHLAVTVPIDHLAAGERAVGLIVAPDMRLARQTLRFALGFVRETPQLTAMLAGATGDDNKRARTTYASDGFILERGGREVSLECLPATRGGSALRGRSLVGAALDEAAFFRDEASGVVNDEEIYRAIAPRILPHGQVLIVSTPFLESGLLYDTYAENWGNPQTALVAHAPTLSLNPQKRAEVERERLRNPDNARREFDAEFITGGASAFFDLTAIKKAAEDEDFTGLPPVPGAAVFVGADFGFRSDSSALVVAQVVGPKIIVSCVDEMRPSKGNPLKPSEVVESFARVMTKYKAETLTADGHYREAIVEHLSKFDLGFTSAPEGQVGKATTYVAVRQAFAEGRITLPNHPRLLGQLRQIISRPLPGGGLAISAPRAKAGAPNAGGHGDIVSALVLAIWKALQGSSNTYEHLAIPSRLNAGHRKNALDFDTPEEADEYEDDAAEIARTSRC